MISWVLGFISILLLIMQSVIKIDLSSNNMFSRLCSQVILWIGLVIIHNCLTQLCDLFGKHAQKSLSGSRHGTS